MRLVPTIAEHFDALNAERQAVSTRSWTVLNDEGIPVGIGGYYVSNGKKVIFSVISDELRKKPKSLLKIAREILGKNTGILFAICDYSIEAAPRFLEHLGFEYIGGDAWELQPQSSRR